MSESEEDHLSGGDWQLPESNVFRARAGSPHVSQREVIEYSHHDDEYVGGDDGGDDDSNGDNLAHLMTDDENSDDSNDGGDHVGTPGAVSASTSRRRN